MVVNKSLELGVLSRDLAENLKSALVGFRWSILKSGYNIIGAIF